MKRSDAELLAIAALLLTAVLFATTGCKTSYEAESASHATAAETLDTDRQVDKHVVDAPDKTTTTIEEYALGGGAQMPAVAGSAQPAKAGSTEQRPVKPQDAGVVAGPPFLLKRTVIVAEHGAVTTDVHVDAKSQERADSTLDEQHSEKHTFDFLHGPFALLGGLVVLAGVAYVAWRVLKPRLLP